MAGIWDAVPAELRPGLPWVWLLGQELVRVEQHRGLVTLTETEIALRWQRGRVLVMGRELKLLEIGPDEAVIGGKIDAVSLISGGN